MSPLAVLTPAGWIVVHALWQGALVAGVTALAFGLLRHAPPAWRYRAGCASLALMAVAPLATVLSGANGVRMRLSATTLEGLGRVVDMPALLWWASVVIPIAGAVWLAGLLVQAGRLAIEARRLARLRVAGEPGGDATSPGVARAWPRRPIRAAVRFTGGVVIPMVIGWRRPVILLPASAGGPSSPGARGILLHELAHVARRDYLVNLFQVAADTLLFFHPAARWVSHQIRTEREYCCDDMALAAGAGPAAYARALSALEHARVDGRLAVLASSGTLADRIRRIAGEPRHGISAARGAAAFVIGTAIAALVLSTAILVPPSLPWKAEVRRRTPPAAGVAPMRVDATLPDRE